MQTRLPSEAPSARTSTDEGLGVPSSIRAMLSHPRAMHRSLVGGHVQRVTVGYAGEGEFAILQLRIPGETFHVVLEGRLGVGVIDADDVRRVRHVLGDRRSAAQSLWRSRLEGSRIVRATERGLDFELGGRSGRVEATGGVLRLEDGAAVHQGAPGERAGASAGGSAGGMGPLAGDRPTGIDDPAATALEFLRDRGTRIAEGLASATTGHRRAAFERALAKAEKVLARRAEAVRDDLRKMNDAQRAAVQARLFVAEAARSPPGASILRAVDWSSSEGRPIEMTLDPARPAKTQIEAMFKRARRLKEGARIADARLVETEHARAELAVLSRALSAADPDFDALEARARTVAPRDFKLGATAQAAHRERPSQRTRPPFRAFTSRTGAPILVGRGAAHNDELTFKIARPHHLWLHAKDQAGAHVIVPLDKGSSCPAEALVDAAHLAAHFSEARGARIVDVQYTPRRYIRKPRGSAAGAVLVEREKVIVLRIDDDVLQLLLAREANTTL